MLRPALKILVLALLLALGARALWLQEQQDRSERLALQRQLQQESGELARLSAHLAQRTAWEQSLSDDHRRLNAWKIEEIAFDLHLAERELRLDQDFADAEALLQSASDLATGEEDPAWLSLRAALASDLLAVKSQPHVDVAAAYLRLQALTGLMAHLQAPQRLPSAVAPSHDATTSLPASASVASRWQAGWQSLLSLIRIQHSAARVPPLPSDLELSALRLRLQGLLQDAAWALLHRQTAVYHAALQQCDASLSQHALLLDAASLKLAHSELQELTALSFDLSPPGLDASLRAVRQLQGGAQ